MLIDKPGLNDCRPLVKYNIAAVSRQAPTFCRLTIFKS